MDSRTPTCEILSTVVDTLSPSERAAFLQALATKGAKAVAKKAGGAKGPGTDIDDYVPDLMDVDTEDPEIIGVYHDGEDVIMTDV